MQKNVSEYRMSLELGKSAAYIRNITNGVSLPSVHELLNIIQYFEITPAEFFVGFRDGFARRAKIYDILLQMQEADLNKVELFLSWIQLK